jgi:hypothetical protein
VKNTTKKKELLAKDLKAGLIVVVQPSGREFFVTMLVSSIDIVGHSVRFYSQSMGWITTNRYDQHGVMYDECGRTVRVYEFYNNEVRKV